MPDLTKPEIESRLYWVAASAAAGLGRAFRPEADADLRQRIGAAADEVLNPSGLQTSPIYVSQPFDARLAEAEAAARRLVLLMVEEAQTLPDYPPYDLGEQTLSGAFLKLCPCWPFCN